MQVKLKVIGGKNDGREIKISVPEFIIGRGEEAHLRPASDMVSRKHCSVKIKDGKVIIEDLGSRNGTFINGAAIQEPHVVQIGDTLRVGRLQFDVIMDHAKPGNKKPKVENVVDAAARTKPRSGSIEDDITGWLSDDIDDQSNETTQFNLEETMALSKASSEARKAKEKRFKKDDKTKDKKSDKETEASETDKAEDKKKKKKKKKEYGKLPQFEKDKEGDSKTAADEVLRKFFNSR